MRIEKENRDRTLDEAFEEYLREGLTRYSDSTKETYRSHIRSFRNWLIGCDCGWINQGTNDWSSIHDCSCDPDVDVEGDLMFSHLKHGDLIDWVEELEDNGYSPQTVQKSYYSVYKMLEREHPNIAEEDRVNLVGDKIISGWENTKKGREEREQISYLTADEVEELWNHVPEPRFRNELIVRLMWHTGMRQSDVVDIRTEDVDWENREIKMYDVKNDEPDTVYFGRSLKPMMRSWIQGRREALSPKMAEESKYLFYGEKSVKMDPSKINNEIIKPAAKAADLQGHSYTDSGGKDRDVVTGHILRHSFARKFLLDGGDIRRLKELLRHSEVSQTEKYLKFRDSEVKDAREKYGPQ